MTAEWGRFYIEGQTEFILAAMRKSDERFQFFRNDPDVQAVRNARGADDVPLDLAIRFARKVIADTNEYHSLLSTGTPPLVSVDADCSLMSSERGFEWITQ